MLLRQFFDSASSTYTYLLADSATGEAVFIDCVFEQHARDAALVEELGLQLRYTLDTHVHADHVTGAWLMKERFGSDIVVSADGGVTEQAELVQDGDQVRFGAHSLRVRATPGHTNGCLTFVLDDSSVAFTGDALLIRGAGRTDFQQGDSRQLYRSIIDVIFALPDDTTLYPAHDYAGRMCTTVGEEKRHNPRLGGTASEGDFVGFMKNLGLPHPRQIEAAVPANLRCGRPETGRSHRPAGWAPAVRNFGGILEVSSEWVAEHVRELRLIDVREPAEFDGELGHVRGAELVPLSTLGDARHGWDPAAALVTICRSGGRSAQAALLLEKAGFDRVANMAGGMIRWRGDGLPTE